MTNDQFEKLARLISESHEDLKESMDVQFEEVRGELRNVYVELRDVKDRFTMWRNTLRTRQDIPKK